MKVEFANILKQLYDEFGEDLIMMAKDAVYERLQETRQGQRPPTDPRTTMQEDGEDLVDGFSDDEPAGQSSSDDSYADEDTFADNTMARIDGLAVNVISTPQQVIGAVRDLVLMAGEVRKFEEAQITKRTDIAAQRDVAIAKIEAQRALLQDYLNRSFDERAENFRRLFSVVDEALATNNMPALAGGLEAVIKLADSSPFKDLRTVEETTAALVDPDHKWDF